MLQPTTTTQKARSHRVAAGAVLVAVGLCLPAPGLAAACACRQSAQGQCERWYQEEVPWSMYFGPGQAAIADATFELLAKNAFAAWQNVQCDLCAVPDAAGAACEPAACARHPLGLRFAYAGRASAPTVGFSCGGTYCDAAAPGSAQIAVIRDTDQWPASKLVVSAMITTTTKSGKVLDTDIVLWDNGLAFCADTCKPGQYALAAVMIQEIKHFVGLGYAESTLSTLAGNLQPGGSQLPAVDASDAECACSIYATSAFAADCATPTVAAPEAEPAAACQADRNPGQPRGWSLVWVLAAGVVALRYGRRGWNSLAPWRRT